MIEAAQPLHGEGISSLVDSVGKTGSIYGEGGKLDPCLIPHSKVD